MQAWVVGLLLFVSRCSGLDEAEVCPLKNSGMNYNVEYETYSASTTLPDLLPGTIISNCDRSQLEPVWDPSLISADQLIALYPFRWTRLHVRLRWDHCRGRTSLAFTGR